MIHRYKKKSKPINCILSDNTDDIPSPKDLDKSKKNLVIFDDCVNERNQTVMDSDYTRGRHSSCNCIYLSQSYFQLPRRAIRNDANTFILFKLNSIHIVKDSAVSGLEPDSWQPNVEDSASHNASWFGTILGLHASDHNTKIHLCLASWGNRPPFQTGFVRDRADRSSAQNKLIQGGKSRITQPDLLGTHRGTQHKQSIHDNVIINL